MVQRMVVVQGRPLGHLAVVEALAVLPLAFRRIKALPVLALPL